jgi:BTB/POZ domain
MPSPRIKFNVGGTRYEVSQSVLDRYPDSMLRKISSSVWQDGAMDEKTEEIFIDRSGGRFEYVLDYMRDSRVELPLSIPKGQLLSDMDFFGIDYGDGSTIVLSVSKPNDLFHSISTYRDYFASKSTEIQERYFRVAVEKLSCDIANEYFSQLGRIDKDEQKSFFQSREVCVKFASDHDFHLYKKELLNEHLHLVGLTCIRTERCNITPPFTAGGYPHPKPYEGMKAHVQLI